MDIILEKEIINNLIIITIVFCSLVILLFKVKKSSIAKTHDEYFLAGKKTKSTTFLDSTVAYGYQIAAISLFATWGFIYGFWTVLVPIFWGIGFFLLKKANDKGLLKKYLDTSESGTIHSFLSKRYNLKILGQAAAFTSLVGLSGTAFFEAEFTSNITASVFPNSSPTISMLLFAVFVAVALAYILIGGLKTVISTDRLQLGLGFVMFNMCVVYSFVRIIQNGYVVTGRIPFSLSALSVFLLHLLYPNFSQGKGIMRYSSTLTISSLVYVVGIIFIVCTLNGLNDNLVVVDSVNRFFEDQKISHFFSLGVLSLISLLLANGLWQFVDISTWQRLSSMEKSERLQNAISKSLSFASMYSSVTWLIAIFFGMGLKYLHNGVNDGWTVLNQVITVSVGSGNLFDVLFVLLFFASMIFIMFSTLDSIISAISFTTYHDIVVSDHSKKESLGKARQWTIVYVILFALIYILIRQKVSNVDSILYTFYSFQLALFPSIAMFLLRKRINTIAALLSLIGGALLSFIPLFINSEIINPYSAAAIFSVLSSLVIYFIAEFFSASKSIANN